MKIAEIFYSIQGEGILAGIPSVFVRTSGCNLRCTWCDTPYTSWKPEGVEMSNESILEEVARHPAQHAVITGGEPMLFAPVVPLTHALKQRGIHVTIETAGTVYQPVACDLMSISPKLANSTPQGEWQSRHESTRYQPAILKRLITDYDYQLKFVISTESDLDEVHSILSALSADRSRVLLMPEGTTPEVTRARAQWLAETCKRESFRYSPRLHVEIWGDKRGV